MVLHDPREPVEHELRDAQVGADSSVRAKERVS
jgi:hypothetical protein